MDDAAVWHFVTIFVILLFVFMAFVCCVGMGREMSRISKARNWEKQKEQRRHPNVSWTNSLGEERVVIGGGLGRNGQVP